MQEKQNRIITVIGHKGYGKTSLTEALFFLQDKPTIIADPRWQYNTEQKRRLFFANVNKFRKYIYNRENYKNLFSFSLECVVKVDNESFIELAEIVAKMKKVCFVVDEVDMFFDTRATNKNIMYKIVHYGRHNQIDLITTSRRPANISRNLTSQTDIFYISRLREPADKKYIKDIFGLKFVDIVGGLDRFSFLKYEDEENYCFTKTKEKDIILLGEC